MNEELQRSLLMAQLDKKRALRQKYLRQQEPARQSPLTGTVMTNVMLMAIRQRVDIFAALRAFRLEAGQGEMTFDDAMGLIGALAEVVDCSPYELFLTDTARQKKTVCGVLQALKDCDGWEDIRTDGAGGCSFSLPGFDYAWRMSERPSGALLFEKTAGDTGFRYTLTLGDGTNGAIPGQAVLWQEETGPLQEFTEQILSELDSGWPIVKQQLGSIRRQLSQEAETLQDLAELLKEAPVDPTPLLKKTAQRLNALLEQEASAASHIPAQLARHQEASRNTRLLVKGAITGLQKMTDASPEALSEIVYMLEAAAQPL